jgi:TIR domain
MSRSYDVFICHAWEDKERFVRPLAEALRRLGVSVWYDEFSLEIGDSVSRQIDNGIAGARFGIVVISRPFIGRPWPRYELQGLVNRDIEEDLKILPIWHGVSKRQVAEFSPSLSDKFAIDTQRVDAEEAAIRILRMVRPDIYRQHPRAELERMASGEALAELQSEIEDLRERVAEYQCPHCGAPLSTRIDAPVDPEQKHWDLVETFECGLRTFAGTIQHLCPSDPKFPSLDDYALICDRTSGRSDRDWQCDARPKTEMARKVPLDTGYGSSEDEARRKVEATYLYRAGRMTNQEWFRIQMGVAPE